MSFIDSAGRSFDRLIGVFSPQRQAKNELVRDMIHRERQYAAAREDRLTGAWRSVSRDVNELIGGSSPKVTDRVQQLVRDFPFFARAVDVLVNLSVGSGLTLRSMVKTGDTLNKKINLENESLWKKWMDQADWSGKLHFHELCRLAKRQDLECGEYLFVRVYDRSPGRLIPYCLQAVEATRLTGSGAKPLKSNVVRYGIEVNPKTGKIVAYHIADEGYGSSVRVEASRIIHDFRFTRPGQLRGISPFTPAVLLAHDIGDLINSALDTARMASKYLGIVTTSDIGTFQKGRTVDKQGKKLEYVESMTLEYLNHGDQINFPTPGQFGPQFEPTVKLLLHMLAIGLDVSYELLTGFYDGISFSNYKGITLDQDRQIKPHRDRLVRGMAQPVYRDVMDELVMRGKIRRPGYNLDPEPWLKAGWILPGRESPDVLKESKANIDQIKSLTRSPQEIVAARGRDIEEVMDEIKEFQDMAKERGLVFEMPNTPLAGNPAAVEPELAEESEVKQ